MALGIGYGVVNSWKAVRASSWPTVPAEIIHLEFTESIRKADEPAEATSYAMIAYRYVVGGKTYFSSQRRFGSTGTRPEHTAETYSVGARVMAFYSPDDPQTAVLEAGFDWEQLVWPAAGLIPILFVAGFYWFVRRTG